MMRKIELSELTKDCRSVEVGDFDQKLGFISQKLARSSRDAMVRLGRIEIVHEKVCSAYHAGIEKVKYLQGRWIEVNI
jgi:hypothetical protein